MPCYLITLNFCVAWIAEGCAVLGCGGGGATYPAFLVAREALREGKKIRVVDHTYFQNQPLAWLQPCGFMGSPSVSSERIPSGNEVLEACTKLQKYLGVSDIAAIISCVHSLELSFGDSINLNCLVIILGMKSGERTALNLCFFRQG